MVRRKTCLFLALVLLAGGCVFDSGGVSRDGSSRPDAPDSGVDRGADRGADTKVPGPCQKTPAPVGNVCLFTGASDSTGQSGTCSGGAFVRSRFCFTFAFCAGGTCQPTCGGSTNCLSSPCTGADVCTALFTAQTVRFCCVKPNPANGTNTADQTCKKNEDCLSGLCTDRGNCYQPCVVAGDCGKSGLGCENVKISEGSSSVTTSGCVPSGADAGPDQGKDQGHDSSADLPAPDLAVPDLAVPDKAVSDKGQPDLPAPDQAVPDKGQPDLPAPDQGQPDQSVAPDAGVDVTSTDTASD